MAMADFDLQKLGRSYKNVRLFRAIEAQNRGTKAETGRRRRRIKQRGTGWKTRFNACVIVAIGAGKTTIARQLLAKESG